METLPTKWFVMKIFGPSTPNHVYIFQEQTQNGSDGPIRLQFTPNQIPLCGGEQKAKFIINYGHGDISTPLDITMSAKIQFLPNGSQLVVNLLSDEVKVNYQTTDKQIYRFQPAPGKTTSPLSHRSYE